MSEDIRDLELLRDDELTRELRAICAPPGGESYWTGLEQRILAALDEAESWWTVPDRWVRVGLFAAGLALVLAGSLYLRAHLQTSRTMAYETVIELDGVDETLIARRDRLSEEEATLRRLLGNR
jgi:hypothetical protein